MFGFLSSLFSRLPVGDRVAVIKVKGALIEPDRIVARVQQAKEDKSVKALVLRIDSPGGSVGASQEIYRALEDFKSSGKPLLVSMGNVSASGGYYISAPADVIFANPGTITGSIGVIVQHTELKELLEKLGVRTTTIKTGKFKDTLSPFRSLSEEEKEYLQKTVEDAYEQFLQAVLKYRSKKIGEEKLREVADGRVFTGRVAKELGLVDELGNLQDAINRARQLAKVPEARVFYMEDRRGLIRRLMEEDFQGLGNHYPFMLYYLMK
ncbi:MAG: signal peptide peptidase SppA [Aquificaceae bacterium]|nr:signal peptide peptidase SppA [Aquificaceae bacterium]MCS7196895.1 signal peptide peptidase SppA [Aquificaceae bacterium]MDW8031913.1 signal peptide peptidase SppA [Aquificaceae bacterium]MDW8294821.1 signal peptide peptidase SppA [Aquificaceae bacterium]